MNEVQPASSYSVEMIRGTLGNTLKPGELGVLLAWAGVGKTACLTHIAMEHLLNGLPVLHVCIDEMPDKIKVWYQEFIRNIVASNPEQDSASLQHQIEPLRFILAYLHHSFNIDKLEQSVRNLTEQARFSPTMVILDGLNFDHITRSTIEALREFAGKHGVSLWMSARTHRHIEVSNDHGIPYPCHEMDDLFQAIMLLEPVAHAIKVRVLKHEGLYGPVQSEVYLNPQTYLLQRS